MYVHDSGICISSGIFSFRNIEDRVEIVILNDRFKSIKCTDASLRIVAALTKVRFGILPLPKDESYVINRETDVIYEK